MLVLDVVVELEELHLYAHIGMCVYVYIDYYGNCRALGPLACWILLFLITTAIYIATILGLRMPTFLIHMTFGHWRVGSRF